MPLSNTRTPTEGAKVLQERLHELLSKLASTIDVVKNWPEQAKGDDDASIHVERTSKLIASIREVIAALQRVEGVVKNNEGLRTSLDNCRIPLDLLDLLDHGGGLNPECFSRGLLREALGQLAGLKRRKLALEMLGTAVQSGLNKRNYTTGVKRSREESAADKDGSEQQPPAKKQHT